MMYLISIGVKEDCEDYDTIWAELERIMNAVSIPIVRVDWTLYDDNGEAYEYDHLFYAQTFEIGMGYIMGVLDIHEIRSNLEFCDFYNGDPYKTDMKKFDVDHSLEITKNYKAKYHPDEVW